RITANQSNNESKGRTKHTLNKHKVSRRARTASTSAVPAEKPSRRIVLATADHQRHTESAQYLHNRVKTAGKAEQNTHSTSTKRVAAHERQALAQYQQRSHI